ncbi:NfeD family protein [Sabulicella glaciei]|uniref:NfeD family protein n=1 Tax=Sabulicella glaciei TaxID=2984948 RepID=A0ABT3NT60_9PROT|nr:NfeD family protein [Roseococcus sp. MDT2-1-1]MCW8085349.1 NfeD family protein [Roseococcus sp. MDT2-1-1]
MGTSALLGTLGLILLGAELLVPGVLLLWIGLATLATALVVHLNPMDWIELAGTFVAFLGLSVGAGLWIQREAPPPAVNRPGDGLVGRVGTVAASASAGMRVRLGDSEWEAMPEPGLAPPVVGEAVVVTSVEGTRLVVRPPLV